MADEGLSDTDKKQCCFLVTFHEDHSSTTVTPKHRLYINPLFRSLTMWARNEGSAWTFQCTSTACISKRSFHFESWMPLHLIQFLLSLSPGMAGNNLLNGKKVLKNPAHQVYRRCITADQSKPIFPPGLVLCAPQQAKSELPSLLANNRYRNCHVHSWTTRQEATVHSTVDTVCL